MGGLTYEQVGLPLLFLRWNAELKLWEASAVYLKGCVHVITWMLIILYLLRPLEAHGLTPLGITEGLGNKAQL